MANRAPSLKVLLIEDNPRDAELIQEALQAEVDCEVRVALTEEMFKELLERHAPHIVISDSNVRGFDGFSALKITLSERPDIPFVFCSGNYSNAKHNRAMDLGAAGWVTKNATFDQLLDVVKRLCARHLQPPIPRLIVISARDANWQAQLSSTFEQREICELRDIEQLSIADEDFIQLIRDWCLKWHYSPAMCGLTTIQFRPR